MEMFNTEGMGLLEMIMIGIAVIIVAVVLYFQKSSFDETKKKIGLLASFFPHPDSLTTIESSITKSILDSKSALHGFINNPPAKHIPNPIVKSDVEDLDEDAFSVEEEIEYTDVTLIKVKKGSNESFGEVIYETNAYLCKNVGTSADFTILQDICERKIEALEAQISNSINVPLYLGLAGTFVGIITGLIGIAFNVNELFDSGNMAPLRNLLIGVVIAMVASFVGLALMIYNSSVNYKKAIGDCEKNKNAYYDFLRRELMPTLSNSMASSLNSLKGVLGEFIGKFGHNLDAYANSAELLNDNIEKQHLLLVEINKMKQKEMATEIAEAFGSLKDSADSLGVFRTYQESLNSTITEVNTAVQKIENVIGSFDNFAAALKVVVENQGAAGELQAQFRTAIEKHFPTGSDTREMYRKQFDELTTDAKSVSEELNAQLKASTEYIKAFIEGNKTAFDSLGQINTMLSKLVEYSNVQATCYTDLKAEIASLKQEQVNAQRNATALNKDLLTAVREMVTAVKTLKN